MTETRITPEQPKPKERLSDEQMGNLLSAIGNHEAKAITLLVMRDGNIYTVRDLYREFLSVQEKQKGWKINQIVPFQYCSVSLAPLDLVKEEILNDGISSFGYAITDYGIELGVPLAGLLLDFSERHNISLNKLFGSTVSKSKGKTMQTEQGKNIEFKKRSPSTTLKILYELLTSPTLPIRQTDLGESINEQRANSLGLPLTRLSELGLIEYTSKNVNKPFTFYKLSSVIPEGELPIKKRYRTLTKLVFDIIKMYPNRYLTIGEVCDLLPEEHKNRWKNAKAFRGRVSSILSFLNKQKYLDIEGFKNEKQSEINVTDDGRIALSELLEIMYRIQNQDIELLEKGKRLAQEIIVNPNRVSNLLKRAKEASAYANKSSTEDIRRNIVIVVSAQHGITNKEIQKFLKEKYGVRLGIERIMQLTAFLLKQKSISVEKKGSLSKFYPKNQDSV